MRRPPRETYVRTSRVSAHTPGWTVEPGVEFRPGDDFEHMSGALYLICMAADGLFSADAAQDLAERVARLIVDRWPDRAYFIEVHGASSWIQIFQPFGLPKNPLKWYVRLTRWLSGPK